MFACAVQNIGNYPDQTPVYLVYTRAVVDTLSRQCRDNRDFRDCRQATIAMSTENWTYTNTEVASVKLVYTTLVYPIGNPVYSYTGGTLGPLQCMHSVHYQCTPSVYTNYTGIWSG